MRPNKPDSLHASLEASTQSLSRRTFVEAAVFAGTGLTAASLAPNAFGGSPSPPNSNGTHDGSHEPRGWRGRARGAAYRIPLSPRSRPDQKVFRSARLRAARAALWGDFKKGAVTYAKGAIDRYVPQVDIDE